MDPVSLYTSAPADVMTDVDQSGEPSQPVDEKDLGSPEQLAIIEAMLHRGAGVGVGLHGVALTR